MTTTMWRRLAPVAAFIVLAACTTVKTTKPTTPPKGKATYGEYGLMLDWFDKAVKPGDDFYLHAAGTWDKTTPIPADRSVYGLDAMLGDKVETDLRAIAESAAAGNAPEGSIERKVGDFYASYMDEAAIEAKGFAPMKPYLDKIMAIKTPADLAQGFVDGIEAYGSSPIGMYVHIDEKKPEAYAVHLY